jgi:2-alkyl-3-oxoalkanoate reductase
MKIAVTGGTGFLGRDVVRQLLQAGHEVTAISRGQTTPTECFEGVQFVRCDIHDHTKLALAFDGCETVIHCAALSAPWGKRREFIWQNGEGTACVVKAAETTGVNRLIHVSSSSVCFSFADRLGVTEDSALPYPVNAYAKSKQLAEREAARFSGDVFIIRPRGIYGPGDSHLLPRLLRVMKSRPLPLLRGGKALVDITHVAVVADAILGMVSTKPAKAGIYNVSHGEPIAIHELVETIAAGLGILCRWRSLPMALAFAGARCLEIAARMDPRQPEPLVTAYGLGLFGFSHTLDISKAARELNWLPKLSLQDGLRQTLTDYCRATR